MAISFEEKHLIGVLDEFVEVDEVFVRVLVVEVVTHGVHDVVCGIVLALQLGG